MPRLPAQALSVCTEFGLACFRLSLLQIFHAPVRRLPDKSLAQSHRQMHSSSLLPSFADVSRNHSLIFLIKWQTVNNHSSLMPDQKDLWSEKPFHWQELMLELVLFGDGIAVAFCIIMVFLCEIISCYGYVTVIHVVRIMQLLCWCTRPLYDNFLPSDVPYFHRYNTFPWLSMVS